MPHDNKEGRVYKTVHSHGRVFDIRYGYYEEYERGRYDPIPIYPNFKEKPEYTDEGFPFVTAMQDVCPHFDGEDPSLGCFGCKHYTAGEDLIGICKENKNKKHEQKEKQSMKKLLAIFLSVMLTVGLFVAVGISASAENTAASTEERTLITLPEFDFPDDTQINLSNYDLPIEEMKALFPETVEVKSENGAYYAKDIGAASADVFCYNGYERYDMTLVDGYWTVELTEEELSGDISVTFYGEEYWQLGYLGGERQDYLQISTTGNVYYIGIDYGYDMVAMGYVTEDEKRIENEYKNGVLITHKVGFDVEGSSFSYAYYDASKKLSYISVYTNNYYYLMEEGWSNNWSYYEAGDTPEGFENYTLDDFNALVSHDIGCQHEWVAADCDTPKTCSKCEKTKGEALGHSWVAADCDTPKTCTVCNETEGEALGHNFADADCDTPKTCTVCGLTEGEALGHSWVDATTEAPKTCTECGETEGEPLPKPEEPTKPDTPDTSEKIDEPNWFVKIWNAILDFFRKLFGLK